MEADEERFETLRFDRPEPDVLRITIDTGAPLNAVGHVGHRELVDVWRVVDRDPRTRVAIVTGADGAFSAGGGLRLVEDLAADWSARVRVLREARELVEQVIGCPKPIVSAIEGPAVGAGLVVALLADVSIAGRSARLLDGHTRLGVAAGDHAAIVWPLLCGLAKAKYHLLTGDPVSGEEAERIGLVSLVVDDADVQERAVTVARQLAQGSQSAIRWTKHTLNHWLRVAGPTFDASLAYEFLGFGGPDVHEGVAAIRGKRAPRFTGPASEPPGGRAGADGFDR